LFETPCVEVSQLVVVEPEQVGIVMWTFLSGCATSRFLADFIRRADDMAGFRATAAFAPKNRSKKFPWR